MTDLLLDIDARGVATLTLDRPDRGNAYTPALLALLAETLGRLKGDAGVRVLLLRGNGKHFCVGADIAPVDGPVAGNAPAPGTAVGLSDVCLALDTLGKPTLALVHGACVGGGVALAACCDIVLAASTSFFSIPEVRIGFSPGPVAPFFVRAMGARQVRRYALTGERFTADEAHRLGLVHQLVDSVEPGAEAGLVDSLLLGAPGAQAELKHTLAEIEHAPITSSLLATLQQRFNSNRGSAEALEGRAAFAAKRKPGWYPTSTSD